MTRFVKFALTAALATSAVALSAPASAATILGLFNTGVNNAGQVLAAGATEQHYVITKTNVAVNGNSNIPLQNVLRTPKVTNNAPAWSANDAIGSAGSSWITQSLSALGNNRPGKSGPNKPAGTTPSGANIYDYTLQFNLGTLTPGSASISGVLQADNFAEVYLNGILVDGQPPVNAPGIVQYFRRFSTFSTNNAFVAGLNTLTFRVYDYGAISGLRVGELVGSAVPEPATWAMMLLGFGAVATQARRRRKGASVLA
jgi:hypothetical protein